MPLRNHEKLRRKLKKLEAHENNILKSVVCLHELMTLNKKGRSLPTEEL
jgi:PIN domain nuclease of toxin-antitoxin system